MLRKALLLAPLFLAAPAFAHSPYLKPNMYTPDAKRPHVTVEASFAEGSLNPDVAMKAEKWHAIAPDGTTVALAPAATLKDATSLEVPLAQQGTYRISSGERTGLISKLSEVGKFPCNTIEGELAMPNLGTGGSSTFSFSARNLGGMNDKVIDDLKAAYESGKPVSLTYDQSHWPKEWFDREQEGWFIPVIDGFACFQKTDYNIVRVTPRQDVTLPHAPRLPTGGPR